MRIDLHAHTTASDGTVPPAALVTAAADAGLSVVGLTDHDTTAGWDAARAALPAGLTLVPGAELSCRWFGTEPSISLHLLAYLFDPTEPALAAALDGVRRSRETRAERMVELLRADGVDLDWPDILERAGGGSVGRPHLAQALVRRGLADTVGEAFQSRWLGARYRVPKEDLDVFAAVRLVRAAGGVTVFAHPRATVRGRVVPDELIGELAAAGLDGIEADHEDHTPVQRAEVRQLAAGAGLIVTGASDFHGTNKTVGLGAQVTAPEEYERLIARATFARPWTA